MLLVSVPAEVSVPVLDPIKPHTRAEHRPHRLDKLKKVGFGKKLSNLDFSFLAVLIGFLNLHSEAGKC